jgi:hypothetical protein
VMKKKKKEKKKNTKLQTGMTRFPDAMLRNKTTKSTTLDIFQRDFQKSKRKKKKSIIKTRNDESQFGFSSFIALTSNRCREKSILSLWLFFFFLVKRSKKK